MPTYPAFVTMRFVPVEEPTTNSGAVPMAFALTERRPQGLVVPTPTNPVFEMLKNVLVAYAAVLEPTAKSVVALLLPDWPKTERSAYGEEEPIPVRPA
jgi:hypothetical protein